MSAVSPLAIFDIDGTLLRSARLDEECWCEAVERTFGIRDISTDWGAYTHSTDRAILDEVLRTRLGRPMTEVDETMMLERFVSLLTDRVSRTPNDVAATPGAVAALALLRQHGWRVAIGTGGWRRSALLKLGWAGVDVAGIPAAFAEDGPARERIILTAAARCGHSATARVPRIVYLGDGAWDARASAALQIGFVGVGVGTAAERLHSVGAGTVLKDFADTDALLTALESATVPTITARTAGTLITEGE